MADFLRYLPKSFFAFFLAPAILGFVFLFAENEGLSNLGFGVFIGLWWGFLEGAEWKNKLNNQEELK